MPAFPDELPPCPAHVNYAGAGLPTTAVVEAITRHLADEVRFGPMEAGARVNDRLDEGYRLAALLLGCHPDEIAFGIGHGRLYGDLVAAIPLQRGDCILVSRLEWVGNPVALKLRAASVVAVVEVMPSNDTTEVDVAATARMLDDGVKLVSLTWIGASRALINPAAELGAVVAESKAHYIIDASQALGQRPIDVATLPTTPQLHG